MRRLVVGLACLAAAASTFSWAQADDQEIARSVEERLTQEMDAGKLRSFDINLKVIEGTVTLQGSVASAQQRKLAVDVVRQVDGVKDVEDGLEVETAASPPPQKTLLSSLFGRSASRTSSPSGREPRPSREPGESTAAARPEASPTPAPASAPTSAPSAKKPDEAQVAADRRIGEQLTRQLQKAKDSGQLKGFGLSVHVENGYVWLKGRVGSADQQQMVLNLARRTEGVRQVINELSVHESAPNIAQNLNQLFRSAEVEKDLHGSKLSVKVDGPDVWLTGTISKPEQEQQIVDWVRKVPGVRRVISGLEVSQASAASVAVPAPRGAVLPPVAVADMPLPTSQAAPAAVPQPTPAVRFTKQAEAPAEEAALVAHAASPVTPGPAARPASAALPVAGSMAPAATMPMPATGAYVYYNQAAPQALPSMAVMDQTPRPLGVPAMAGYAGAMVAAPVLAAGQAAGMMPAQLPGPGHAVVPASYDHPSLPGYAWPTYAAHPNYAAVTYPKQYSPSAWPYIGPFYPYPQVPLGWRKVTLKWDDGWWNLDFKAK